jgi:hypothetical protein
VTWPPEVGESLPNAESASGAHEKLARYSLKLGHPRGKAEVFLRVLAVTADDLGYVAERSSTASARRLCPAFGLRASTASTARSSCRCADFVIAPIESRMS